MREINCSGVLPSDKYEIRRLQCGAPPCKDAQRVRWIDLTAAREHVTAFPLSDMGLATRPVDGPMGARQPAITIASATEHRQRSYPLPLVSR